MNAAKAVPLIYAFGYTYPKQLTQGPFTGRWAAIAPQLFTTGLFIMDKDLMGWQTRFCYETEAEAAEALANWDGTGFPPGWWLKQKPEDITNPKGQKEGKGWIVFAKKERKK